MGAEKNPAEAYLTEKTAGFLGGMREGATEMLTGRGGDAQRMMRGFSPADAMGAAHGFGQQVGKGVGAAGLAAGGAAAIGAIGAGAQMLYDAATKTRDFKAMLEVNPDLAARHEQNPRLFNQMFSTLRTFNPSFSKDPLVAGSYMREMSENPLNAGGKAVDALNFRDKAPQGMGREVVQAARSGFGRGTGGGTAEPKKRTGHK